MKTLNSINNGDIFRLKEGSDKMYRKVRQFRVDGTIYYLTQRAYGSGKSGFFSTEDREVF